MVSKQRKRKARALPNLRRNAAKSALRVPPTNTAPSASKNTDTASSMPPQGGDADVAGAATFNPALVKTTEVGNPGTLDYRVHFSYGGAPISPWHDIPLAATPAGLDGPLHFCCEIPKWTRRKFEVATKEELNPIKQDEKKGVLREYKWGDMMFNYGFFPQTWEDPEHVDPDTNCRGDNDPLDVVEVGVVQMKTGEVAPVKVLGVLGMIDDGETDWKVFTIRLDDPIAHKLSDLEDLEREIPGAVTALREWLRVYKVPEGKPLNQFTHEEKAQDKAYAVKVIRENHEAWEKSHGQIQREKRGRSGTGYGVLNSPSMSELEIK